ncbi:hypothetical protein C1H46_002530 [Malus baccata]|uniref:AN1-type domain-containing protein n=1 Tax=Malus baccata TaxID=106549 RepID=A0A540NLJ1_MALBA|nr:hypothetical protein C1H46_002530 [Malus baccata]
MNPSPLIFPRSVSPYVSRRKSDDSTWHHYHHHRPDHSQLQYTRLLTPILIHIHASTAFRRGPAKPASDSVHPKPQTTVTAFQTPKSDKDYSSSVSPPVSTTSSFFSSNTIGNGSVSNGKTFSSISMPTSPAFSAVNRPLHQRERLDPKSNPKRNCFFEKGKSEEKVKETPTRCGTCRKRVGLTGFSCRCGDLFCAVHRYSDKHKCPYDYRTAAQDAIAKANPVVKAEKLDKI